MDSNGVIQVENIADDSTFKGSAKALDDNNEALERLKSVSFKIPVKIYDKLMVFFRQISMPTISGFDLPEHECYATKDSLRVGLPNHFGHRVDFLGERLHGILTNNAPLKRVYFADFL